MSKSWNELLEYETRDLVVRYFQDKHKSEVNAWKVNEVTSNFIQGREYFNSAKSAGFTVRPLLLYYGVLALSRALILTLTPKLTENTLKGSHGIDIKNWTTILKNKDFENLELAVGEGSFSELLRATENMNYLRAGTNGINWKGHLTVPPKGQIVLLKQLFQYLPDLNQEYLKWTGNSIPFAVIEGLKFDEGSGKVVIKLRSHGVDESLLNVLLPSEYCKNRQISNEEGYVVVRYENADWSPNITQKWHGPFDLGDPCIVPVLSGDVGFNLLSTMFAISYTFGMMARYFPSSWIALRRVEKGDKIYPLIHTTLNFIEEKFPIAILDFLKRPYGFEAS